MTKRTNICSAFASELDAPGATPAVRASIRLYATAHMPATHFACAMPQIWSEFA